MRKLLWYKDKRQDDVTRRKTCLWQKFVLSVNLPRGKQWSYGAKEEKIGPASNIPTILDDNGEKDSSRKFSMKRKSSKPIILHPPELSFLHESQHRPLSRGCYRAMHVCYVTTSNCSKINIWLCFIPMEN